MPLGYDRLAKDAQHQLSPCIFLPEALMSHILLPPAYGLLHYTMHDT